MFKKFATIAMSAIAVHAADIQLNDEDESTLNTLNELGCLGLVTDSLATFTITSLEKTDGNYQAPVTGDATQTIEFNYCTYLDDEDLDWFA